MRTLAVLIASLLCAGAAIAQQPHSHAYQQATAFDPKRDAARDIDEAIAEAQQSGRRILLDVGGEWCVWCRRLDSLFVRRADLADFMHTHYVVVKVNYSPENKNELVLSRYPQVAGYPHLFVLSGDGRLLHSQDTGALEAGKGHDPEKVLAFLRAWAAPTAGAGQDSSAAHIR